jgi:cytochrome c5
MEGDYLMSVQPLPYLVLGALPLVAACGAGGGGDGPDPSKAIPAQSSVSPSNGGDLPAGTSPIPGAVNGGSSEGGTQPSALANPSQGSALDVPCDVAQIVSSHCTTCHAATPKYNAPMSLMSAADFQALAPGSSQSVRELALTRINASSGKMPPVGTVAALNADELSTLNAWLSGGAATAANGCSIAEPMAAGAGDLLAAPTKPSSLTAPYQGWDDGVECYKLTANAGDKVTPYKVGTAVDQYVGFSFMPPWQGTRYARAFRAVTDNAKVLHHWLLFQQAGAVQDGAVAPQLGTHPDGQLVMGWAPGGSDAYYSHDLGIELTSGQGFVMEAHYNSSDANALDASGVELCVTKQAPENLLSLSWLGTDSISGTSSSGTCRPSAREPIHIVGAQPHMHLKGRHMKVVLTRAGGGQEVLHDEDFSFENQRSYPLDVTVNPGDSLTTTCTFSSPASFGKGTNDEMCYFFTSAYPADKLADGGFLGTLIHGADACLGR